ncbi:reverse transcriptase domain-containing protein [Tanacetum coccineum]
MTPIYKYLIEEILPEEKSKARAIRRKARRYVVTNGILYKRSFSGPWLRYVGPLQANYALREIHEGSCSMHVGPRSVVEKALRLGYYWPTMHADARKLIKECKSYQCFTSVKHPQANGLVERANRSLGEGIKAQTKAVILVEIGMPTSRTTEVDVIKNNEALEVNLDLSEDKRDQAAIQEAKIKAVMEKYYNARVCNISFKPGDLVYRSNEASHVKDGGKLGPKWEGPYEVTKALGKGAYKLRDRNGSFLHGTFATLRNAMCIKCKHLSHAR